MTKLLQNLLSTAYTLRISKLLKSGKTHSDKLPLKLPELKQTGKIFSIVFDGRDVWINEKTDEIEDKLNNPYKAWRFVDAILKKWDEVKHLNTTDEIIVKAHKQAIYEKIIDSLAKKNEQREQAENQDLKVEVAELRKWKEEHKEAVRDYYVSGVIDGRFNINQLEPEFAIFHPDPCLAMGLIIDEVTKHSVKKAYNRLAYILHPDKGGCSEAMAKLNEHRDYLIDNFT